MSQACFHAYITGRVQGVWFRAETQKQAMSLGLCGWVRNLPDGRVEVIACGDVSALHHLEKWLQSGPKHAEVHLCEVQRQSFQVFHDFSIRQTPKE